MMNKKRVFGIPIKYKGHIVLFRRIGNEIPKEMIDMILRLIDINFEEIEKTFQSTYGIGSIEVDISEDGKNFIVHSFYNFFFEGDINENENKY